jgi:predicted small lipoprotein YifL
MMAVPSWRRLWLAIFLGGVVAMAVVGCGRKGPPQPPERAAVLHHEVAGEEQQAVTVSVYHFR